MPQRITCLVKIEHVALDTDSLTETSIHRLPAHGFANERSGLEKQWDRGDKANRGSAGIDDETIAMFEQNLSRNLYKLWNRMSSGSYFPPPVQMALPDKTVGFTPTTGFCWRKDI